MNFQTYTINSIYEKEELFATLREFAQLLFSYAKSDLDDFFFATMCKSEIPTSKCSAARTKKRKTCKKIATLHALYPSKLCLTRRVINELTAGLKVRRQEVLHNTSVYLIMVAKVDFRRRYI